ncbi:hypothetical protein PR048_024360 [Dryococelus australis]|uniref:Uncharacterized protein n=1 Tax=Dryococelus australis TaxID=614101 RepID=A0ABQ9GNC9_9NEOP|nr:hypothetical protein PR048_024360 [Dryococelus australis]
MTYQQRAPHCSGSTLCLSAFSAVVLFFINSFQVIATGEPYALKLQCDWPDTRVCMERAPENRTVVGDVFRRRVIDETRAVDCKVSASHQLSTLLCRALQPQGFSLLVGCMHHGYSRVVWCHGHTSKEEGCRWKDTANQRKVERALGKSSALHALSSVHTDRADTCRNLRPRPSSPLMSFAASICSHITALQPDGFHKRLPTLQLRSQVSCQSFSAVRRRGSERVCLCVRGGEVRGRLSPSPLPTSQSQVRHITRYRLLTCSLCRRGRGSVVVRLQYSPPTKANQTTPGSSHVGIEPDDAAGRRVFSGISHFPCPCIPTLLQSLHSLYREPRIWGGRDGRYLTGAEDVVIYACTVQRRERVTAPLTHCSQHTRVVSDTAFHTHTSLPSHPSHAVVFIGYSRLIEHFRKLGLPSHRHATSYTPSCIMMASSSCGSLHNTHRLTNPVHHHFTSLGRYSLSAGVDRSLVRNLGHPVGSQLDCGGEEKLTPSPLLNHQTYFKLQGNILVQDSQDPQTNGIVLHDCHLRKCEVNRPGALVERDQYNRSATAVPCPSVNPLKYMYDVGWRSDISPHVDSKSAQVDCGQVEGPSKAVWKGVARTRSELSRVQWLLFAALKYCEIALFHLACDNCFYVLLRLLGRGGCAVSLLASNQDKQGSIPGRVAPGFSHVGVVPDDGAGWWVFSGISRFPRPFIPTLLHSLCLTLIGSQRLDLRLDCSPPTKANRVQSPACSLRIFESGNRVGRRRWSAAFLCDPRFPRPFIPALLNAHLSSPPSALKTSLLRAAQISLFTLVNCTEFRALSSTRPTVTGLGIPPNDHRVLMDTEFADRVREATERALCLIGYCRVAEDPILAGRPDGKPVTRR